MTLTVTLHFSCSRLKFRLFYGTFNFCACGNLQILVGPGNDYVAGATHMSTKSVAVPGIGVFGTICRMWFSSFSNIWNFFSESRESSFDLLNLSSYI